MAEQTEEKLIDLKQLEEFIDDVERDTGDTELAGVLKEILELVTQVRGKIERTDNPKELEKLWHLTRDKTYTHSVEFEWQNVNMGIRTLVLKMRNYVTMLFGAITRMDDYQEIQIGLNPVPNYLVGRYRGGVWESNVIPAMEETVTDPREPLSKDKACIASEDDPIGAFMRMRIIGKTESLEHLSAEGLTPLNLIKDFRDSLKKAVEQLGA